LTLTTPPFFLQLFRGEQGVGTETLLNALPSVDTFFFLSGTLVLISQSLFREGPNIFVDIRANVKYVLTHLKDGGLSKTEANIWGFAGQIISFHGPQLDRGPDLQRLFLKNKHHFSDHRIKQRPHSPDF